MPVTTGRASARPSTRTKTFLPPSSGTTAIAGTVIDRALEGDWSPDGSRIAFIRSGAVLIANADGTDEQVVADRRQGEILRSPRWSPDGRTVAFVAADPPTDEQIDDEDTRRAALAALQEPPMADMAVPISDLGTQTSNSSMVPGLRAS